MVLEVSYVGADGHRRRASSARAARDDGAATRTERIAIVGLGYVGLPTGLAFARNGHQVVGVDSNDRRVDDIRNLRVDLLDRDLDGLRDGLASGSIEVDTCADVLDDVDVVVICVPTPVDERHVPVLDPVAGACAAVVEHAREGQTFILTSTSFSGTTRRYLIEPLESAGFVVGRDVHVAFSPERVDPGNTTYTQDAVPRVVGGATEACSKRAAEVLAGIAESIHIVASPEVAELTKLFENTFRAVNIALANELADLCEQLDLDPVSVIDAAATKPYGFMPFYPGPGVGGHCIPVDPHYLIWQLHGIGVGAPVIEKAMSEIAARPGRMAERAVRMLVGDGIAMRGARVLVVGLTYKRDVRDLRGSPALDIIRDLQRRGASVRYFDPLAEGDRACAALEADHPVPRAEDYDLVIGHTLHQAVDYSWLGSARRLLDCTYRYERQVAGTTDRDSASDGGDGKAPMPVATNSFVSTRHDSRASRVAKRGVDILLSSTLLLLTLPLTMLIAIAIKIESPGPVFYRCRRVGFRCREFSMLKFRKMHDHATGPGLTVADDPRFTRVGSLLAMSKFDELPQLWNVLKGDMSIVGPRPESPEFVSLRPADFMAILHQARPGITGPTQLAYARESELLVRADNHAFYVSRLLPAKLAMDARYVARRTMRLDLTVLWWTAAAVVLRSPLAVDRENLHISVRRRAVTPAGSRLQGER